MLPEGGNVVALKWDWDFQIYDMKGVRGSGLFQREFQGSGEE